MANLFAVIDYGAGNIGSVLNILKKVGVQCFAAKRAEDIASATHLLLPGVGAFDHCMSSLRQSGLISALTHAVLEDKKPLLGICVGFQMLFSGSEEGALPGLGWLDGTVVKFKPERLPANCKIPHMGWSEVVVQPHPLWQALEVARFYFVHSYYPEIRGSTHVLATCRYGQDFCCAAMKENIMGVQFHPEKSHRFGMQLLRNFAHMPSVVKTAS